jgi:hypothetical protein
LADIGERRGQSESDPLPAPARVLTFLESGYTGARQAVAAAPLRLACFTVLALATKWPVLGKAGFFLDTTDAQHCSIYEEAARLTIAKFHELPLWNPYYCGGIPALGTPSARFASPTFLLTLIFGTLRAEPLILMAMTVVGLEGTFRYVRARGGGALGSFMVAPIYALCGCFAWWPNFDWIHFYGFELVPWALLGARGTVQGSRRGVVVLAVATSWMIGFGGTYAAPLTALGAAAEGLQALVARRRRGCDVPRLAAALGAAVFFVSAMSLVRLWPVAENLSSSPRVLGGTEGVTMGRLWLDLFGNTARHIRGDYLIGIAVLPLCLAGGLRRRALPLIATSLVWLWMALGYGVKPSLFALVRNVPPYTMLRAPERCLPFLVLGFAVLAALALRWLEVSSRRRPGFILLALACVGVFGWNGMKLVKNDAEASNARSLLPPPAVVDREFRQTRGNRWLGFYYAEMSRGTLACFDDYNVAESPDLRGDLPHEEYLRDVGAGTVTQTAWAPNRIALRAELVRPARVYVHANWHPGWHATGGALVSENGLLAVDLPAGSHDVVLRFLPRSAILGGLTSLAALLVAAYVWTRTKTTDEFGSGRALVSEVALFASPWLVPLLGLLVMREPARPPAPMLTPEGDPIVVPAPPEDSTPVDARWVAEGIALEAVRFSKSPGADRDVYATVELDWRLEKKPPKGLAISVRLEGGTSGKISLDYAFLSDAMLIDDAPLHTTLRDVSERLFLPGVKDRKEIKVSVGLYYARRDGEHLTDVRSSKVRVDPATGTVAVGSFVVP